MAGGVRIFLVPHEIQEMHSDTSFSKFEYKKKGCQKKKKNTIVTKMSNNIIIFVSFPC